MLTNVYKDILMKLKLSLFIVSMALLSGCTSMVDAMDKASGLGVVSQETSTFDNAKIVSVSPNSLYAKGSWGNVVKLGAKWSSASPEYVAIILSYDSNTSGGGSLYMNLTSMDINIDGTISSYSASGSTNLDHSSYNTVSKSIYTSSKNSIIIPYSVLESMVAAKDCRIRIHTGKGYEDAEFSIERIPGGKGTAILSIKKFMKQVAAIKSS